MIHVLEDDVGVRDSLAVMLRNRGYVVRAYPDAESFFRSGPPQPGDTVLVDLLLPGISGADFIRWLHRLSTPPRIVVMSGRSENEIESELRGLGITHVVRKPLTEGAITASLAPEADETIGRTEVQ